MSIGEILLISIILLVFVGPKQLPEVARVLGKIFSEVKKATSDLGGALVDAQRNVNQQAPTPEKEPQGIAKDLNDIKKEIKS